MRIRFLPLLAKSGVPMRIHLYKMNVYMLMSFKHRGFKHLLISASEACHDLPLLQHSPCA